jgi:CRP-like cAMP-binding protein
MTGAEDALSRAALFSGMSVRDRRRLAASMTERTFAAGSVVTEVGRGGIGFFIIGEGTATVHLGGEERQTLGPGDHFGEVALIDEGTRSARVTADTVLRCFRMSG